MWLSAIAALRCTPPGRRGPLRHTARSWAWKRQKQQRQGPPARKTPFSNGCEPSPIPRISARLTWLFEKLTRIPFQQRGVSVVTLRGCAWSNSRVRTRPRALALLSFKGLRVKGFLGRRMGRTAFFAPAAARRVPVPRLFPSKENGSFWYRARGAGAFLETCSFSTKAKP